METPRATGPSTSERLISLVKGFERAIVFVLIALLLVAVVLSTVALTRLVVEDITRAAGKGLDFEQMFELFGSFLIVLVGMELLTTLKSYVRHGTIHMEVVLEVALVALAQKVIILNPRTTPLSQFGLAALILSLAGAFWWVRITRRRQRPAAPAG